MLGSGSSPAHSVSMIYQVLPILRVTLQEKGFRNHKRWCAVLPQHFVLSDGKTLDISANLPGRPFFTLIIVLPVHHSLQSGSHRLLSL